MILKLAYKNIIGTGFRAWLNIFILSLAYFTIIAMQGFLVGWQEDATREIKAWDIADGQYWNENYDPYDPYSLDDSFSDIPVELSTAIEEGNAFAILLTVASIYPEGRMRNITLKGIDPSQNLTDLPSHYLKSKNDETVCILGSGFADNINIHEGDYLTLRWRDKNGTFDAVDIKVAHIFSTTVLTVENNQIWISLDKLEQMLELKDQATIITIKDGTEAGKFQNWEFKDTDFLLQDLENMIQAKSAGVSIMYILLLFMAILAIFDTQILSIFRRRKEIGTMMALGMHRNKIIQLFTLEGVLHALFAIFVGALYGIPLLNYFERTGLNIGVSAKDYGLSGLTDALYPIYGWKLVLGTIFLVLITVTFVSFLPTRKISKLKPTDALKGKFTK